MSELHIRRISTKLHELFDGIIDLSDWAGHAAAEIEKVFLSRSLAAYALVMHASLDPSDAASRITDGADDNGIDALTFDETDRVLYLVQSKWVSNGRSGPSQSDVTTLINGFRDLINERYDRFNTKIEAKKAYIRAALDDANARIVLVFVHTGEAEPGVHASKRLADVVRDVNDPSEILQYRILKQSDVHDFIASQAGGPPIDLEVVMHEWGTIQDPNVAYYGLVGASDIAAWYNQYGPRLFAQNLRHMIPESDVNTSILETLKSRPEYFWYFNNGITVVCDSVTKKPRGGGDRRRGEFVCHGVSVVNGAQTVGCIGAVAQGSSDALDDAQVSVRFISVGSSANEFARGVTRATNTQNRINSRDFVALDRQQTRLQQELALDRIRYTYKTGEPDPLPSEGCSVIEASIALACALNDSDLAVQAKREIGRLWQDIGRPPYTLLFNEQVSGAKLWRAVSIMRVVDGELARIQREGEGRGRGIAIHGNRLILHLIFRSGAAQRLGDPALDMAAIEQQARDLTPRVVDHLEQKVDELYPTSYMASLFKNARKCKELVDQVQNELTAP